MDEVLHTEGDRIPMRKVAIGMIAKAWYPVNYFRINFGAQDRMQEIVKAIIARTGWAKDHRADQIRSGLEVLAQEPTYQILLSEILHYVPYRFIRPWFSEELRGMKDALIDPSIREKANASFDLHQRNQPSEGSPYKFDGEDLVMNPVWVPFIRENFRILHDFTLANLLEYLQRRNPQIPNLIGKLHQPLSRSLAQPRKIWRETLPQWPAFSCIYSRQVLTPDAFDLDHFLPWSYLAHDQLWNLIPASPSANASKSDQLPAFDAYFPQFAEVQKQFFDLHFDQRHLKALEDYAILFQKGLSDIRSMTLADFSNQFEKTLLPQFDIARNMGFSDNWHFIP
jgi:hypothetical protein